MSTFQHIDVSALALSHPHIGRRVNSAAIIQSVILMALGFASLACMAIFRGLPATFGTTLLLVGAALILCGLYLLFQKKYKVVYLPTGSAIKGYTLYFDRNEEGKLLSLVEDRNLAKSAELKPCSGGGMKMEVLLSRCNRFAAVQLSEFVPYEYRPITDSVYFEEHEAKPLADFIIACENSM
ncbi:MAG: hypothetical protein LBN29_14220 [Mediterranea sp.]|jgi:hypothetical protein|nr:hypothetical protein [Mediterranea sp.]